MQEKIKQDILKGENFYFYGGNRCFAYFDGSSFIQEKCSPIEGIKGWKFFAWKDERAVEDIIAGKIYAEKWKNERVTMEEACNNRSTK